MNRAMARFRSRPADLAEDGIVGLILRPSGPAILGISAHALQMLVNAWFVADLGATAIATIAIAYPVTLLVAALDTARGSRRLRMVRGPSARSNRPRRGRRRSRLLARRADGARRHRRDPRRYARVAPAPRRRRGAGERRRALHGALHYRQRR